MPRKSQPGRVPSPTQLHPQPIEVRLPELHPHQQAIFEDPSRFKVVVCGRQFGKTSLGIAKCLAAGLAGGDVWWVAPTFDLANRGWRVLERMASQVPGTRTEGRPIWRVRFPTGGTIEAKSADNPASLRGPTLDGLVIDEAAQVKEETWDTIQPGLSIRRGWAMFISTPFGMNWFFDLYEGVPNWGPEWKRWKIPSVDSPFMPPEEVERARGTMGSLRFAQEYLAEFISYASGMFHADWFEHYQEFIEGDQRVYALGGEYYPLSECKPFHTVDLAWSTAEGADYTVIASWAVTKTNQLIMLDMIRGRFEPAGIMPQLRRAWERWGGVMVVEHQPRQPTIIEEAQRTGIPIRTVRADRNKEARAALAAARMESHRVWFPPASVPWFRDVENELLAFPAGRHDDIVDVVAYAAIHGAQRSKYETPGTGLALV